MLKVFTAASALAFAVAATAYFLADMPVLAWLWAVAAFAQSVGLIAALSDSRDTGEKP